MKGWSGHFLLALIISNQVLEVVPYWKGCPMVNYKCAETCMKKLHTKGRCVGYRCECIDPGVAWGHGHTRFLPFPIPLPGLGSLAGLSPLLGVAPGVVAAAALLKKAKAKKVLKGLRGRKRPAPVPIPPPPVPVESKPEPIPVPVPAPRPPTKSVYYKQPVTYYRPKYQPQPIVYKQQEPVYSKHPSQTMTIHSNSNHGSVRQYNPDANGDNRPDVFEHQDAGDRRDYDSEDREDVGEYEYEYTDYYYEEEGEET